ncbi:MAG: Tm-1-like ATP-binding domain-containing protein, partial [Deltaproteobacteria bacterium]|nr:Tm-1-like ATP-binding domain-containing protein [Deltaproteobacteria bacterium]
MESVRNKYVIIIGTLDTKGAEVFYLQKQLQTSGLLTKIIDVGISSAPACRADISRQEVALKATADISSILKQDDGKLKAMDAMARGALLLLEEKITSAETAGVVALGGGVGTWIGMQVMHALPFGFPKMMISTLPFDIRPYIGSKDIMIVPSVTDILGLNPILRKVLQNAAGAIAGMVGLDKLPQSAKKVIGITALGVTTPLVNGCKEILEA